jgi:hypothetical protein
MSGPIAIDGPLSSYASGFHAELLARGYCGRTAGRQVTLELLDMTEMAQSPEPRGGFAWLLLPVRQRRVQLLDAPPQV